MPAEHSLVLTTKAPGRVFLVGAGPGSIEYLTLQAHGVLTQATVLIYDALVDDRLLTLVPPDCLKLPVGKRGGQPSTPQAEINRLLIDYCRRGGTIVRLKSGDPFIFGRCAAELQALRAANCPVSVIPGLSSALAAPLLAGIPLTDPNLSQGFAVVTAHNPTQLNWPALAGLDTLVLLMAGRNLTELIHCLTQHWPADTAIAIIHAASQPQQKVWVGSLATILAQVAEISLSPAVVVVGRVVTLRHILGFSNE